MIQILLLSALAFADIPPDDDYTETCLMENMANGGEGCESCENSMSEEEGSAECTALAEQGLVKQCQTYGASVWTEIWCPSAQDADADPEKESESNTGCSAVGLTGLGAPLLLAMVGLRWRKRDEE